MWRYKFTVISSRIASFLQRRRTRMAASCLRCRLPRAPYTNEPIGEHNSFQLTNFYRAFNRVRFSAFQSILVILSVFHRHSLADRECYHFWLSKTPTAHWYPNCTLVPNQKYSDAQPHSYIQTAIGTPTELWCPNRTLVPQPHSGTPTAVCMMPKLNSG